MKKNKKQDPREQSHLTLRVIAFALAAVLGISAIGYGVSRIGHKDPGYYEIEVPADEDAPAYGNGFTLIYYFDGSSGEIRTQMNLVKELYASVLLRSYKLLDEETTYEGYVNLANLNGSIGQPCKVSQELFTILEDAWAKTQEARGFNLFAASLYAEWNSILSLDDISEFDPAENPDMAARIRALAEKSSDLGQFGLRFDSDSLTVTVEVSQGYLDFLEENEYDATVLSTNLLKDAYRLELVSNALEEQGYCNGYLYTDSGLTLSLSGHSGGMYAMYGFDGDQVVQCAAVAAAADSASSFLRAFPLVENEILYHIVSSPKGNRYYHPNFVTATGEFAGVLASSCAVRNDGDVVDCCYENLALFQLSSREEIAAAAAGSTLFACTFLGDPTVQVATNDLSSVQVSEGFQAVSFS